MANNNQKKGSFNLLYLLVLLVAAYLLWTVIFPGGPGAVEIDYTTFSKKIGLQEINAGYEYVFTPDQNKIHSVIQQGNTFYILEKEGATEKKINDFGNDPSSYADFKIYAQDYYAIAEIIRAQIASETDETEKINFTMRSIPQSILDFVLPFLYIGLGIVAIFLIYRSFSNRGGLGNMGRNRATVTINGPTRFADVAGIEEEKEEVQEIVQFLRNPRKFLDLGARIPKGFLLVGQPGTGKTLMAKAIAGEAGVPFFSISGSDFSEMLVGVGPSRMRDLFEQAKFNAPCIIFIDEIDSIARMRGVGASGVSDENEQTLNQLLVQMDGFTKSEGVIVLAATNRPDVLDQALLRPGRFDRQIVVQMPDVKGREKILEVHTKNKPISADVDLKRVAQIISGFSGADIENLMNESAIIAAKKDKKKISMQDITEGINKVLLGPQKRSRIITDEDKKITAFHEAGHAVVSRILQKDQVVQEVSIIPRGFAAGYTLTNDRTEKTHQSKTFLNGQLAMLMAGRVAEDIFIGDICIGCQQDLKQATNLAEKMVTNFGMSEKLGPMFYGKEEEIALRMYNDKHLSESLQSVIDAEVKGFVIDAEKAAREILNKHGAKVRVMANVLLERETIYGEDIALIMEGKNEKTVIAEMDKRDKANKDREKQDHIDAELARLDRDLKVTLDISMSLLEAKLTDDAKIEHLKGNFELARAIVRKGEVLKALPTLDNLDEYAKLVEVEVSQKADKETQAKETTKKDE